MNNEAELVKSAIGMRSPNIHDCSLQSVYAGSNHSIIANGFASRTERTTLFNLKLAYPHT